MSHAIFLQFYVGTCKKQDSKFNLACKSSIRYSWTSTILKNYILISYAGWMYPKRKIKSGWVLWTYVVLKISDSLWSVNWNTPRTSDCGSHFPSFTLLGFPGNESVSHIHSTRCFSLENASRRACLLEYGRSQLLKIEPMLKYTTPYGASSKYFCRSWKTA